MTKAWCVRVDDDGEFRSARRGRLIVWSVKDWMTIDPCAARQFLDVNPKSPLAIQLAFMRVSGLDAQPDVQRSVVEAYNRFGGNPYVTSSHPVG